MAFNLKNLEQMPRSTTGNNFKYVTDDDRYTVSQAGYFDLSSVTLNNPGNATINCLCPNHSFVAIVSSDGDCLVKLADRTYQYFTADTIADVTASGYFAGKNYSFDADESIKVQASDGPYEVQLVGGVASVVSGGDRWVRVFPYYNATPGTYDDSVVDTASISADSNSTIVAGGGTSVAYNDYTRFALGGTDTTWLTQVSGYWSAVAPSGASVPTIQSFYYDGQTIEFQYRYVQGRFWVIADNEVVLVQSTTNALNQPRWFLHDFGSAKRRLIQVVSFQALRGAIAIESGANMYPARIETPTLSIMGDSITAGTGAGLGLGYAHRLQIALGGVICKTFGIGGSGYINDTSSGRFINRLTETYDSDYLMVAGGINDLTGNTVQEFSDAVDAFYAQALTNWNGNKIIIISNFTNAATVDGSKTTQFRDVLKDKAAEIGAGFVDCIRNETVGGWITDDNLYLLTDGTHPDNEGHEMYKVNIVRSLMGLPLYL